MGGISVTQAAHSQSGDWVWVGGSDLSSYQPGVHGAQGVPATDTIPSNRSGAGNATDKNGKFWLFGGTGVSSATGVPSILNDLWEFDPVTSEWSWWGGSATTTSGAYGTQGVAAPSNAPGSRDSPVLWTDRSGNIWLFGGVGNSSPGYFGRLNDLWKFDVGLGQWAWIAGSSSLPTITLGCEPGQYGTQGVASSGNVPAGRAGATGWTGSDGNLWLFGGDSCTEDDITLRNDLWKFDLVSGEWTWISGLSSTNGAGAYGTLGAPSTGGPGARVSATNMGTDSNGNMWLFGGNGYDANGREDYLNDLWEFSPSTGQWTWQSGSSYVPPPAGGNESSLPGVYGTLGQFSAGNVPGGRQAGAGSIDDKGRLRLFGGNNYDSRFVLYEFNDIWFFNPASRKWAWMGGGDTPVCVFDDSTNCYSYGELPSYGTMGVASPSNVPGSRASQATWTDASGNLWLFGGVGLDSNASSGVLNDVWKFAPELPTTPVFGTMTFSPSATVAVGTREAITISDTLTYAGVPPTGAVTYVLNGVSYTATCVQPNNSSGSPETCSAQAPASTIATLPYGSYTVTGSLAPDDNYNTATAPSGTFIVAATASGCTVAPPSSNTMDISYFTLAESDRDSSSLGQGVSSNYVLSGLGKNGLPVFNTKATADSGMIVTPRDLLADGEITWWSPPLNNGGPGGSSDVVQTSNDIVSLPFSNDSFFPPNGTGPNDSNGFQTAMLTGTLVAPSPETVSFTIASDDMAFLYLDGQIACDDGGVHAPFSVPCTTSMLTAGVHTLQIFYADLNPAGAALDFTVTTSNVGVGVGNQLAFGTMTFAPTSTEPVGTSQTITINESITYSGAQPTGSVSFVLNGVSYAAACTTAGSPANQESCSASVPAATIAALPVGVYTVTGSFKGDCSYADSTAPAGTLTITPKILTFGTMTFAPVATVLEGTSQAITISDTITYPGPLPLGAVAYVLNGVGYTAACTASGSPETCTAQVPAATIAALPPAVYTVTGSFAGDGVYAAATASPGLFTVTLPPPDFSLANSSPLSIVTQHRGKTTISITPINGFSGIVSLSCGTVPLYVTCEWNPANVSVTGGLASAELTIDTSAIVQYLASTHTTTPASGQGPRQGSGRSAARLALAALAFPALLFFGRRRRHGTRLLLCAVVFFSMLKLSGCSGHYPDSTTPGSYSITILGLSGAIQHSTVVTLVVTP